MMDIGGDNPVTLIVKAPNQRIADQTVDCFLEWTVRKLKEHLEIVYPSKPKHNQQKLIYSGKLLPDHVTLKEVLRQMDEAALHTVHLVCAPTGDVLVSETSSDTKIDSVPVSPVSSNHSSVSTDSGGGLRYRGPFMPGMENANFGANPMMAPMMPPGGYPYSPEHYMWMQQMYSQYMMQYMQYYQNAYPTPPHTPAMPVSPVAAEERQPANQDRPNNAPPANQNIRMNAQGGPVDDDDEEDLEHRDWLDYIYVLFRFLVLTSIVYFYSTFSRFVAVSAGFFIIYLLQNGWLNLRRREQEPAQQTDPPAPEPQQEPVPEQPQQQAEMNFDEQRPIEAEGTENTELANSPETDNPAQETPQPVETERAGVFAMTWRFFSTFFTSLVPQQPPAVNAN